MDGAAAGSMADAVAKNYQQVSMKVSGVDSPDKKKKLDFQRTD